MPNLNKVMLMGNMTRDPELKFTPKGTAVCQFGIAINRVFTVDGGEKREEVTFIDVESYGKQAETIGQYFKKGRPIYVEGRLRLDQWEDKQSGQKRSKLKVVLEGFQFIGDKKESTTHNEEADHQANRAAKKSAQDEEDPGNEFS